MENAAEALKIAAAVLIFIIAISSSFSLFGTAKHTADSIMTMRDKQSYLDAAELDGGILYTSSSEIQKEEGLDEAEIEEKENKLGVTTKGDRIVKVEDVISTISRYSKEKYGVTILKEDGTVIARYDSNTEQIMSQWYSLNDKLDDSGYIEKLNKNVETEYVTNKNVFNKNELEKLYKITVPTTTIKVGAPWYGTEKEIQKRIACDLNGTEYEYNNQIYQGKTIINDLTVANTKIVEVINEIDNSTYLKDTNEEGTNVETGLLQEYSMPTIEIVYIILND